MLKTGDIALFEPEIAVNTGNIIRLCAGLGATLHLIHPLGFTFHDKGLKRAGLDYHDIACIKQYSCFEEFIDKVSMPIIAMTTKSDTSLFEYSFSQISCLLYGPETRGLPDTILTDHRLTGSIKIPQVSSHRSMNLSNAVAVGSYEQARQLSALIDKTN